MADGGSRSGCRRSPDHQREGSAGSFDWRQFADYLTPISDIEPLLSGKGKKLCATFFLKILRKNARYRIPETVKTDQDVGETNRETRMRVAILHHPLTYVSACSI